jgi:hypothetical protein
VLSIFLKIWCIFFPFRFVFLVVICY